MSRCCYNRCFNNCCGYNYGNFCGYGGYGGYGGGYGFNNAWALWPLLFLL